VVVVVMGGGCLENRAGGRRSGGRVVGGCVGGVVGGVSDFFSTNANS
jgi:hypothetical protein